MTPFCDFSYFYMTYLKSEFEFFEGGGGKNPPSLKVYFQIGLTFNFLDGIRFNNENEVKIKIKMTL